MSWDPTTSHDPPQIGRVLVVDADAYFRSALHRILSKGGYDVVEAEDGAHALEIIRAGLSPLDLDVIIWDIRMPQGHGFEAVTTFRREFPSIPVLVFTGLPGVLAHRPKPIERDKLLVVVAKAMEQRLALKGLTVIAAADA